MSYSADVVKDRKISYACSNMSWHIMVEDIIRVSGEQFRPLLAKIDYPHRVRWHDCKNIAKLIQRVKAEDCTFANDADLQELHRVFETAAQMKSSVDIW